MALEAHQFAGSPRGHVQHLLIAGRGNAIGARQFRARNERDGASRMPFEQSASDLAREHRIDAALAR